MKTDGFPTVTVISILFFAVLWCHRAQEHSSQLAFTSCLCSEQVAGSCRMAVRLSFPAEVLWLLILPPLLKHVPLNLADSVFLSPPLC